MSYIYSTTNRIKFTDIPEKYAASRQYRAKLCEVHSVIVSYICQHYRDTKRYRQQIVDALNILTYCVMENELPSFDWSTNDPLNTMPEVDLKLVKAVLGDFYLLPEAVEWDVAPTEYIEISDDDTLLTQSVDSSYSEVKHAVDIEDHQKSKPVSKSIDAARTVSATSHKQVTNRPLREIKEQQRLENSNRLLPTPKSDLYIQPPSCPRFDVTKVWKSANINGDELVIYTTLPEIPQCQNEISVTTDPEKMTDAEFMRLYPNRVIHTRAQNLYVKYDGIEYDEDLGCVFPIEGFTSDQIKDNIIKYPHLFKLKKLFPQGAEPFFRTIEINGELFSTAEIWDTLPEAKIIPRDTEFIKEYVIRRYLLEKDMGIEHKYNIAGGLDPFLTLFMSPTDYSKRGYTDTLSIVKKCVDARIHYKRSRNPILRRIEKSV